MEKAVIDRIEGRIAVLLLEREEKHLNVSVDKLPKGVKEGDWLKIELVNNQLTWAEIDAEETARRKERIAELMDRLRRRPK